MQSSPSPVPTPAALSAASPAAPPAPYPAAGRHARNAPLDIRPLDGALGAEVFGLRLDQDWNADDFARLHRAHLDHHLLIFRDLDITPGQQIAFSRRFGPLQIHVLHQFQLAGHPEILIVSNIVENGAPVGLGDAGHFWHSDLSYKEKPSLGSMLYAQELPAEGGDTLFANQHLAWETLPAELRQAVEGRHAEHTYLARYAELQARSPWRPNLSEAQRAQ
ncbi:MAG: TauD/TfdA dioxygenase family protein, partial [Janthinobacterium lividum]